LDITYQLVFVRTLTYLVLPTLTYAMFTFQVRVTFIILII